MGYQQNTESIWKEMFDDCGEAVMNSYTSWLAKHPSALNNFEEMMSEAEGKEVVVFLDYDGTLSQIVEEPDQAFMTDEMRSALGEVALAFPTAIVSGRRRDKVFKFVQLKNVHYAGSHGMDISTPSGSLKYSGHEHQVITTDEHGKEAVHFLPAQEFLPTIQEIIKDLREKTKDIKGSMIEDNQFCVSVHYRKVANEEDVDILKKMVKSLMEAHKKFRISEGKKVLDIRPNIDWDKGRALQYLLDTLGYDSTSEDVFPVYIGDDKTDEDAFTAIRQIGRGFPIVVSSTPKQTKAAHSLRDPTEVMSFLKRLVSWKSTTTSNLIA
ncbi:Trehalose-phosphate phosphatase [Morus notabilis]|uniref:Trehalose 6-phosphate phosphatase n=1 Tax=Morus notabilis TaxID=981085 RepID=W9R047_9ROSA|nr:probable trehalose-phosphate phosphatase 2 [Morus notabilis]EXB62198.1 Trehalose-phosphate phosphatase [Morus notabilis]